MAFSCVTIGATFVALASAAMIDDDAGGLLRREVPVSAVKDKHEDHQKIEREAVWAERIERHEQNNTANQSGPTCEGQPNNFVWCRGGMKAGYTPSVQTGRMTSMDPNGAILAFYRGSSDSSMENAWKSGKVISFGALVMQGIITRIPRPGDVRGTGGMYVYTRLCTDKYTAVFGAGSVGASTPWQLIFKRELGDRRDWWFSDNDAMGKSPVRSCKECDYTENTFTKSWKDLAQPQTGFNGGYHPSDKHTKDECTKFNNGCGGLPDVEMLNAKKMSAALTGPPSALNEQGFLNHIDFATYLQKIVYLGSGSEASAKAKLKEWNPTLAAAIIDNGKVPVVKAKTKAAIKTYCTADAGGGSSDGDSSNDGTLGGETGVEGGSGSGI